MALSNIGVEPRREITESLFGILVFSVFLTLDWWIISKFNMDAADPFAARLFFVGFLILAAIFGSIASVYVFVYFTHFIGKGICALLARAKMDPRPKQRYQLTMKYVNGQGYVNTRVPV